MTKNKAIYLNKNKGIRCPVKQSGLQDVNVISCSYEHNAPSSATSSNAKFGYYTVRYIIEGRGYATINGVTHNLDQDMVYISFPDADSTIVQDKNEPYALAWFVVDGLAVKNILSEVCSGQKDIILKLAPDEKLRKIFTTTPYKCKNDIEHSDFIALSAFYEIMYRIARQTRKNTKPASKTNSHVKNASQYVQDNYADPFLSVTKIATEIGIAPKYLSTIFKATTGIDLNKYITNKRLAEANALLEKGVFSITQISEMCGFTSPYYFSTVYKKYNVIPPSIVASKYKNETHSELNAKSISPTIKKSTQGRDMLHGHNTPNKPT